MTKRGKWQDPPLRRTSGKTPQWYIRYRNQEGKQDREYCGFCGNTSRAEATKYKNEFLAGIALPKKRNAKFRGTLKEFYETVYKPERLDAGNPMTKETTRQSLIQIIENRIIPSVLADYPLAEISLADVNKWLREMTDRKCPPCASFGQVCSNCYSAKDICKCLGKEVKREDIPFVECSKCKGTGKLAGLAKSTRKNTRSILSMIFNLAIAHGAVDYNPCQLADVGRKGEAREKRYLEPGELAQLFSTLEQAHNGRALILMARLSLSTGLRISEVLGLRWMSVDLFGGTFEVKERYCMGTFDDPKNKAARKTHELGRLKPEFSSWRSENLETTFVFESGRKKGFPMSYQGVQTALRLVAETCGLYYPGFGFHAFRRMCSTVATNAYGGITAAKYVGKASEASMIPYYLTDREQAQKMTEVIQDKLLGRKQ